MNWYKNRSSDHKNEEEEEYDRYLEEEEEELKTVELLKFPQPFFPNKLNKLISINELDDESDCSS
jgi:hypothetical protein